MTFSQEFPSVAAIDGGYVVTWSSYVQDGSGYGVYAQRYLSDGTRQGHETQVNTYVTRDQYDSSVAAIDGGYIVTWTSLNQNGSGYGVYAQRYLSDGTRQGHETQVNTYVTGDQFDSSVAAIDGGYIVTWTSRNQDGSDYGVYSQRFLSDGTPQGDETQVNTYVTGHQHDSSLAAIDGGYIVTWSSYGQDGSISSVYAQRYSSDGTPQGDETQVNTYVANIQSNSSVAAIDGGYVVTWTSDGQDGSVSGLYSQRYLTDGSPLGSEFRVDAGDGIYAITGKVALTSDGVLVAVWDAGRDIEQRLFQRPAQISGDGDSAITHSRLWFDLPDGDGSEAITSVVLSGYPAGQTFSLGLAGTGADAGKWIIDAASDIARAATGNLTMTSPDHYGVDFTLTITANVTDNAMLSSGSVTSSTSSSAIFTNLIETNLIETDLAADITSSGTLVASNIGTTQGFVAQFGVAGTYGTFSINTSGAWGYTASSAHDEFAAGATYTDRFAVTTADGTATSVTANILGTNDAPAITGDLSASMVRGSSYTLTTTDLKFTDPDDNGAGVTFTVSSLVNGAVRVSGDVVTSFTGEQLAAGVVSFGHTGSNTTAVSFSVMVEDGNEDISAPVSRLFNMTVTPPPPPPRSGGSRFVADPVADHVGGDGVPSDLAATAASLTLLPITALDTSSGISFSFQTSAANEPGFSPFSVAQQAAAITALGLWAETAGLSIAAAAEGETGTIQFANSTSIDYAQFNANAGSDGGTIWTNPALDLTLQLAPGDYGFLTLLHETGHALGLEHAHDLTQLGTVMAYTAPDGIGVDWWNANGVWVNPQTPMVSDIATLQAAYGADTTTRSGDTVYGFNATADQAVFDFTANADPVLTIYDAGGTDTIDLSGYDTPALIDLTPGSSSSANGMTHNIGIAFGTVIENAIGGSGDDIIIGNDAANILTGGAGDDVLIGNLGADTLTGGAGTDTFQLDTLDASDLITDFQTGADGDIIDLSGLLDGLANREDAVRLRYADGSEHSLVEPGTAVAVDGDVALDVNTGGGWNEVAVLQDNGDNLTTGLDSIRLVLDDITGAQSFDI
ncbi:MAG: M10 family metallopeptidase C-terminal domain-containing protein [Devosia sp.]